MPGKPAGERFEKPFIEITFQHGIPPQVGVNGCRIQDVLDVAIERLKAFQNGELACAENADALTHLHEAMAALESRVRRRMEQGVFNTLSPHVQTRTEDDHEDFSATGA